MTAEDELRGFFVSLGFNQSESGSLITILNACGLVGASLGAGVAITTLGGPTPKNGYTLIAAILGFAVGWNAGFLACRSVKAHVDRHFANRNLSSRYLPPQNLAELRLELRRLLNLYKAKVQGVAYDPALSA